MGGRRQVARDFQEGGLDRMMISFLYTIITSNSTIDLVN